MASKIQYISDKIGSEGSIKVAVNGQEKVDREISELGVPLYQFLTDFANKNQGQSIIVEHYVPNGASRKRKFMDSIESNTPAPAPSEGMGNVSNHVTQHDLLKDKLDFANEKIVDLKNDNNELRQKNNEFFDKNRELEKRIGTIEAQHQLDLTKVEINNKSSLSGMLSDVSKPETLNTIKEIFAMYKGSQPQQAATPSLLEGFTGDKAALVETLVQRLKTADDKTIGMVTMVVDYALKNDGVLQNMWSQIYEPEKIGEVPTDGKAEAEEAE